MRVYVDTSALLKRVVQERESAAVVQLLERLTFDGDVLVSSSLAWVEVARALRSRSNEHDPERLAELMDVALSGIVEYPIGGEVVNLARRIDPSMLRGLDAIHLASAVLLGVDQVVAYDHRLVEACRSHGLKVAEPQPPEPDGDSGGGVARA